MYALIQKGMPHRRTPNAGGTPRPGSPRRGPGYAVLPKWQADVKTRLAELGMTVKDLAAAVKCGQSTMHDTLNNPDAKHSSLVPAIHRVLKWNPPSAPEADPIIFSPDALEMAGLYERLPEEVRKLMRDQAVATLAAIGRKPGA